MRRIATLMGSYVLAKTCVFNYSKNNIVLRDINKRSASLSVDLADQRVFQTENPTPRIFRLHIREQFLFYTLREHCSKPQLPGSPTRNLDGFSVELARAQSDFGQTVDDLS